MSAVILEQGQPGRLHGIENAIALGTEAADTAHRGQHVCEEGVKTVPRLRNLGRRGAAGAVEDDHDIVTRPAQLMRTHQRAVDRRLSGTFGLAVDQQCGLECCHGAVDQRAATVMTMAAVVDAKPTMAMTTVKRATRSGLGFMLVPGEVVFAFRALPPGPSDAVDASSVGEPTAT